MSDDEFLDLMDALWGVGGGDSLWAIALEDSDPEPAVIDPAMEARAARDIALAGDLLADPPFVDSVWPEAHDLVLPDDYRADHIDPAPGEETF